jgi:uncharacterized membrane protein YcaP (DUF421 family)
MHMFELSMGISEHVFRAVVVFVFLFAALRYGGKKHVGELAPFDLVVLLILSETLQNAMIGDDTSLAGGLVSAATLLTIIYVMNWSTRPLADFSKVFPRSLSAMDSDAKG